MASDRKCGSCEECCRVFEVPELEKQKYTRCAHQTNHGCAIHATKPTRCRDFVCMWIRGFGRPADRPDKIGAFFWADGHPILGEVYKAYERRPGTAKQGRAGAWLERLARHRPVFVIAPDGSEHYLSNRKEDRPTFRRLAEWVTSGAARG